MNMHWIALFKNHGLIHLGAKSDYGFHQGQDKRTHFYTQQGAFTLIKTTTSVTNVGSFMFYNQKYINVMSLYCVNMTMFIIYYGNMWYNLEWF